jgi:hypothetical protein
MKKNRILYVLLVLSIFIATACEKKYSTAKNDIAGTYSGTITKSGLKSAIGTISDVAQATAVVTKISDTEIDIHCFNEEMDTTFMFNYYAHNDSVMAGLTSDEFESMYGYMPDMEAMSGGMMGSSMDGMTDWEQHMAIDSTAGKELIGGFDMMSHTFGYHFQLMDGQTTYEMEFQGSRR